MAKKKSTTKKSTKPAKTAKAKATKAVSASAPAKAAAPVLPAAPNPSTKPAAWMAVAMVATFVLVVGYAAYDSRSVGTAPGESKDNRPTSLQVKNENDAPASSAGASTLQAQPDPKAMRNIPELSPGMDAQAVGGSGPGAVQGQGQGSQLQGSGALQP